MTGDRIIEVNGELVEHEPHDHVVELIKASGDCVDLRVASMPELLELNARVFQGSDNPFANRGNKLRKSTKMKPGQTGTLRKQAAKAKKEFKVSPVIDTVTAALWINVAFTHSHNTEVDSVYWCLCK